jgi:hypothetical protein
VDAERKLQVLIVAGVSIDTRQDMASEEREIFGSRRRGSLAQHVQQPKDFLVTSHALWRQSAGARVRFMSTIATRIL